MTNHLILSGYLFPESFKPRLMRKHLNKLPAILLIITLFINFHCTKPPYRIKYKYNFAEKLDLFPAQKLFHVGDTVWVQYVNTDNMFLDTKTGKRIQADSLYINFDLTLNALYNTAVNPPGGFCEFVPPVGMIAGRWPGQYYTKTAIDVGCATSYNYNFKLGIVLKEKGIFSVDMFRDMLVQECGNRGKEFPESNIEFAFNLADGNKDIFLSIPLASRGGDSGSKEVEKRIDDRIAYVLRVD